MSGRPKSLQTTRQPFRGASLPAELSKAIDPAIDEHGASKLFRAMTLAWENLTPAEQAENLAQAVSVESATLALRDIDLRRSRPATLGDIQAAQSQWRAAREQFLETAVLTELDLAVLRLRWLTPEPAMYDAIAKELGLHSKQHAQIIEARATHKLYKWLVAFLLAFEGR